jgi:hypothetical protein
MDSSGAADLDESQPSGPPPSPLPQPRSRRPLFYGSTDPEEESPLAATAGDGDAGSSTDDPWTEEADGWSDDDPTSSPASSPEKPAQLLSKKQMRDTARTAVKIGGGMAHTVAAKTQAQRHVGLYLTDEDDQAAIGDPLADLMHRRGDVVGGKLSPDANDFLRSLMGIAGYLAKQVQKIGVVRQLEAGQAAGEVQPLPDVA